MKQLFKTQHLQGEFDKNGFVTCPALINIECQQCGKKGHTKKYCAVAAVATPKKAEKIITAPGAPKKPTNKFAALLVEECEAAVVPVPDIDILQSKNLEKFPCLPTGGKPSKVAALTGWAKMAALPAMLPFFGRRFFCLKICERPVHVKQEFLARVAGK